jgi:integrase
MPKIKTIREDIIRDDEVFRTIVNAKSPEIKAFISILAISGARISEVKSLKAKDLEVGDDYWCLSFLTKKRHQKAWEIPARRNLKFPKDVIFEKIIKPYINGNKFFPESLLFKKSKVYYFKKLKEANPNVYPHLFRHSLATKLSERVDSYDLKEWFGWTTVAMSDRYVHKINAIDNIFKINKALQENKKSE